MSSPKPSTKTRDAALLGLRPELKTIGVVRLSLIREMVRARVSLSVAQAAADTWLLVGLAAEELGLGGSGGAFGSAGARDFGPVTSLVAAVERRTGLSMGLEPEALEGLRRSLQSPLPFPAFAQLRRQPDPFGVLGQELRAHHVIIAEGELRLEDAEARRDGGGYYTPFPLAKALAEQTLAGFENVPAVIDPACGAGTFLAAAFDLLFAQLEARRRLDPAAEIDSVAWTIAALHGVEIDRTALLAARLSLVVRALRADAAVRRSGQLALFKQPAPFGAMVQDRLVLGDALAEAPRPTLSGTERLRLRLLARDVPGRLVQSKEVRPLAWEQAFPLRFSDSEGMFLPGGFGAVITNPPFVPVDRIEPEQRKLLMSSLQTAHRRFDLFIGFVERAFTLLQPDGRATLLIPRTFLTESNAEKCRQLLTENATIERIEELGDVAFDAARVPCVAITFRARKPSADDAVEIVRHEPESRSSVAQHLFLKTSRFMWRLELSSPEAVECVRLAELSVPLGKYFCASWGARGTPVEQFHLDSPDHPAAKPMLKADDVQPFRIGPSTRWLLYDPELLYRPARKELFESEKIVVRKVTGKRGLVCAVDDGGHYTDDSLACVVRKADLLSIPKAERQRHRISISSAEAEQSRGYDLHLVAALLQTPLVQSYYRILLAGGLNVFPELIEALPLPPSGRLERAEAVQLSDMAKAARDGAEFNPGAADQLARRLFGLVGSDN